MRAKFYKFYKNLIDDVIDEKKREEFMQRLDDIDMEILSLDCDIGEEIERQEDTIEIEDDFTLSDEFNYSNRVPM